MCLRWGNRVLQSHPVTDQQSATAGPGASGTARLTQPPPLQQMGPLLN